MVRINKGITADMGYARFGSSLIAVTFNTQDIPSEWWQWYWNSINFPRWLGYISKRYPFTVKQPETTAQKAVWEVFRKAVACFDKAPIVGGAVPPFIGPRSRAWWYNADPGVDPIYYNYFMQQTMNSYFSGLTPAWCRKPCLGDSFVFSKFPNNNYGLLDTMYVGVWEEEIHPRIYRTFLKIPAGSGKKVFLHMDDVTASGMAQRQMVIHRVNPVDWTELMIDWNDFTPLQEIIGYWDPPFVQEEWKEINIDWGASICIKLVDESIPPVGTGFWVGFSTRDKPVPMEQPYFQH